MIRWFSGKTIIGLLAGGAAIGLLIAFPPFHIVSLQEAKTKADSGVFNPVEFAGRLWQNELPSVYKDASDAREVLDAIHQNPQNAKARYARVVGLDGPHHYLLKGIGTITSIGARQIEVSLNGNDSDPDIILVTSMIFGNEVLDATNIISRSQFQRTNDYNAVSAQINKMVEAKVIEPVLKQAAVGITVHFIGCSTKITEDDATPIPMRLVPTKLEIVP